MDPSSLDFFKWLAQVGGPIGAMAALIFWFWRKDAQAYAAQWKGQSEALMQVVKDNTVAITSNTRTIDALHVRMDHERDDHGRGGGSR